MKAIAAMLLVVTAFCGAALAPAGSDAPRWVEEFTISYERSGGLRPDPRSLKVAPGRHATAKRRSLSSGGAGHLTRRFRIGVRQVKRLRAALARADFVSVPPPKPETAVCADCFSYEIHYRGREVTFSDATLPPRLRPVVDRLEALIEAHLPFH